MHSRLRIRVGRSVFQSVQDLHDSDIREAGSSRSRLPPALLMQRWSSHTRAACRVYCRQRQTCHWRVSMTWLHWNHWIMQLTFFKDDLDACERCVESRMLCSHTLVGFWLSSKRLRHRASKPVVCCAGRHDPQMEHGTEEEHHSHCAVSALWSFSKCQLDSQ